MPRSRIVAIACPVLAALSLSGCGETESTAQNSSKAAAPAWVLASAPEGAKGVTETKALAGEGDLVVLRGRIGGREEPITEGSSAFVMMDLAIPSCAEMPEETCATPWDYCCETPDVVTANAATIQVIDEQGMAIGGDLSDGGLSALDEVIVIGTVAPRPSPGVLTVWASGVYRVGE